MSVVAAFAPSPTSTARPDPSPFPSRAALALEQTPLRQLDLVFERGSMPDLEDLVGWEFRGINRLPLNDVVPFGNLVGIKKFVKGFYRDGETGKVMGYNSPVVCNVLDGRWHLRPNDTSPKRYGFYEAYPVDPTSRDNKHLHALMLDYGKGNNPRFDIMAGLRDYLVQVDPSNPDLFLGKADFALGPARLNLGWFNYFILERHRRGLTDFAQR
ncbi:MAG: hypothetical protein AB7T06_47040 [Kofleriaceae bacterium]